MPVSRLDRAERETIDPDAAFIFFWIALNAVYSHELASRNGNRSRLALHRLSKQEIHLSGCSDIRGQLCFRPKADLSATSTLFDL